MCIWVPPYRKEKKKGARPISVSRRRYKRDRENLLLVQVWGKKRESFYLKSEKRLKDNLRVHEVAKRGRPHRDFSHTTDHRQELTNFESRRRGTDKDQETRRKSRHGINRNWH